MGFEVHYHSNKDLEATRLVSDKAANLYWGFISRKQYIMKVLCGVGFEHYSAVYDSACY